MPDKQSIFGLEDDRASNEIYVNKIVSTTFDGHAIVITFGSGRISPERNDEQQKEAGTIHVSSRIALSPPAAIELINMINKLMTSAQGTQAPKAAS